MTRGIQQAKLRVARAATLSAVAGALVTGLGYALLRLMGNPQVASDIAMAGVVLLLAGLPGLVLAVVLTGGVRGGAAFGFVGGIAVRLPVGGVFALNGLNWGSAQTQWFPQIVAGMYLVLLVIEVLFLSPAVKETAAAEARATRDRETPGEEESV